MAISDHSGPQGMSIPPLLQLYQLRKQQWLSTKALEQLQLRKLSFIVHDAYRNVRYYKLLFDSAGVKPEDIRTAGDLAKIPITRRKVFQQQPAADIVAGNADLLRCKKMLTSGSSGSPLTVYRTRSEDNRYDAVWARSFMADGARIWDKFADYNAYRPFPKRWFENLGIWRRIPIPILEAPERKARIIQQAKPDVIRGNQFELVTLARVIQRERINGVKPRLVFTTGSLLDEQSRSLIESVLNTTVYDFYGSTEMGCIAWQCHPRSGYHVNIDAAVVEIINEDGSSAMAGERGRLVCTGLISHTMPFIRYDMGDIGISTDGSCRCGRGLPLIRSIEGRADDFLVATNGKLLSPSVVTNSVKIIPGLMQYRIVQESISQVKAQLVLDGKSSVSQSEILKHILTDLMGTGIEIQVEIVDTIPFDSTGKIRALVSKVNRHS